MKIATKAGDDGRTSLLSPRKKLWKNDPLICFLGSLDEISCYLGVAACFCRSRAKVKNLRHLQTEISRLAAAAAGTDEDFRTEIEKETEKLEKQLSLSGKFVLPGQNKEGAFFHLARVATRRAEREAVSLLRRKKIKREIIVFLNRLSDFLYLLACQAEKS